MSETMLDHRSHPQAEPALALFLDFDGTLVEIAPHPDAVTVEPGLPDTLARLRDRLGGALAIVSGRPIAVLDHFLAPYRFDAAGLHGLEHRMAGRLSGCRPEDHPTLRAAIGPLQEHFATEPGIVIEDKGCSVAVHWRLAPDHAEEAQATARALAEELGAAYRIQWGKAVAEILPAVSGKGRAIDMFLQAAPYQGRRPVFVGDDLTDEHGFETVHAHGGVSIRVGEGPSVAQRRLGTPAALRHCLSEWAAGRPLHMERNESA